MPAVYIPQGYQQVMPYLIVKSAEQFLEFVKDVFGATEKHISHKPDDSIAHAEVQIGESTIMFASATDLFVEQPAGLFIYVSNADETYKKSIEKGATSVMEMTDQPYGRTGGVRDTFGNTWWITTNQGTMNID